MWTAELIYSMFQIRVEIDLNVNMLVELLSGLNCERLIMYIAMKKRDPQTAHNTYDSIPFSLNFP